MRFVLKSALLTCTALMGASPAFATLDINSDFVAATTYPGQTSRFTIRLQNSALDPSEQVTLTTSLPDGVFLTSTPNMFNDCGGVVNVSNSATSGDISISGGMIPQGDGINSGMCKIQVDVSSQVKGTYIHTIPVGALEGVTNGVAESNPVEAKATLAIILQDLDVSISNDIGTILQGNETTIQRIRITNPNPVPLTNLSFYRNFQTDSYFIRIVDNQPITSDCGATITTEVQPPLSSGNTGPTSAMTVTGGTLAAESTCEITYTVEPSRDPTWPYKGIVSSVTFRENTISTDQGATNPIQSKESLGVYSGILVEKYFNNSKSQNLNTFSANDVELRIGISNQNASPVNINLTDMLPAGLTAISPGSSECGGVVSISSGESVNLSGATLNGAPLNQPGRQVVRCNFTATLDVPNAGTYQNIIPAGTVDGNHQFGETSATLTVDDNLLKITKTLIRSGNLYSGDTVDLRYIIENATSSTPVSNLRIPNDLTTMGPGVRVGSAGVTNNTCGGSSASVVPDASSFLMEGMALSAGQECTFTVQLVTAPDAMQGGGSSETRTNTTPSGSILFDTPTETDIPHGQTLSTFRRLYPPVELKKSYSPDVVGSRGISRLRVNVTRRSSDHAGMSNISVLDKLPNSQIVAADPNVFNGCGGTVSAVPGATQVQLTGANLALSPPEREKTCYFEVDVRASLLVPPRTTFTEGNVIPGDSSTGSREYFIASDDRYSAPYNEIINRKSAFASITTLKTSVTVNKEFMPTTINGGSPSRVTISFANTDSSSIDLSGVSITDAFADTGLRLYSNINPTFTDTSGNPNSNGCNGGSFAGTPGGTQITLSQASIASGSSCVFEFNVTAFDGGNHVNTLSAGDLMTSEEISNLEDASATLTVGYQIGVGKGFSPSIIEAGGQSLLTLDIYNTNVAGNDETGTSPALIDTLPAGLDIVPGTETTNCAGGTAVSGTDVSGRSYLQLNNGLFPSSSTCKVQATVTSSSTGVYDNQIPAGALTTVEGSTSADPAQASLRVIEHPTISKAFGSDIIASGDSSTITFTVANPNDASLLPSGLSGVSFSDTMVDMQVASPFSIGGTCNNVSTNASAGATSIQFTNISITPSSQCTVTIPVTSTTAGQLTNQSSGASSNQTTAAGAPSNVANLQVLSPISVAKSFASPSVGQNTPVQMTFTLTNPNATAIKLSTTGFSDLFPSSPGAMVVAPTPNLNSTCTGLSVRNYSDNRSVAAGDNGITVKGMNAPIPANSTCEISLDVTVTANGVYTNTTSTISSEGGIAPAASAQLSASSILATNDDQTGINGVAGATAVLNTFTNDSINGTPASPSNAVLSVPSGTSVPAGISFNTATGDVDVAAGTPAGTYSFDYQICEASNSVNCANATVSITVAPSADLVISKTNTPGQNGEVDLGDDSLITGSDTTYTIVITNAGPDTVTGAIVTDVVGSELTCPAANPVTITGPGAPAGTFSVADLTGGGITLGTLAINESTTLTYTCEVN